MENTLLDIFFVILSQKLLFFGRFEVKIFEIVNSPPMIHVCTRQFRHQSQLHPIIEIAI